MLFRDYARGDMAQARLEGAAEGKKVDGALYVRGDGTLCYYFDNVSGAGSGRLRGAHAATPMQPRTPPARFCGALGVDCGMVVLPGCLDMAARSAAQRMATQRPVC